MKIGFLLIANSVLLGFGLAMDAFSVSIANGLREAGMKRSRMRRIAGTYGFFQALMPMIGWICIHTIVAKFQAFQRWTPWIAWILLCYIGGKMILESVRGHKSAESGHKSAEGEDSQTSDAQAAESGSAVHATMGRITTSELLVQGVATSIDALSVGLTLANYGWQAALLSAIIIAAVTYAICMGGLLIGKKIGNRLSSRAEILGGAVLIFIGFEILIRSFLG